MIVPWFFNEEFNIKLNEKADLMQFYLESTILQLGLTLNKVQKKPDNSI